MDIDPRILENMIVIGDRVLVKLDESEDKTEVGLYLPQSVKERDDVIQGFIVKTGPGIPLADPSSSLGEEPWSNENGGPLKYIPMEAQAGDYALFLRKAAVEINYKREKFLIVPQSAILILIREPLDLLPPEDGDMLDI
ncbi:MAG: co-chaperone GroES [Calditrichaeota bacterium]|nr:co-chaperone GroES [Calditrichota bacterium]